MKKYGALDLLKGLMVCLMACTLLAACTNKKGPALLETMDAYQKTIRWGDDISQALAFIDPEVRAELTPENIDLKRFKHVRVSGYYVKDSAPVSETEVMQMVELRFINKHNMSERTIIDKQRWRWDDEAERWWLMSGLPNLSLE